ncbi:SH3 domain-containing protein [Amphritea opalescens]|uniref:SH3 domain-containing protein n=1 Tax=Amphritea opalescens TaxID=2490544 RepID=A0A430KS96_9GAMM|nr:SH3 domain-containing protein [Amphritea opalescens]RTE66367.1 SH3 domain-containing protein [Amphritea opalescens]
MKIIILRSLVFVLVSLFSTMSLAFDYFIVNADSPIYSAPDSGGKPLTHLSQGNVLLQIEKQGAWSKVFFLSTDRQPLKGWLPSNRLTAQHQQSQAQAKPNQPLDGKALIVSANSLRLRQGPGTQYAVVGSLKQNQQVAEQAREGDWVKVAYRNAAGKRVEAWTAGRYLRAQP